MILSLPRARRANECGRLYFVGRIRTPWVTREDCPKNSGESLAVCSVEVDARYANALHDIETVSHLILLYFMDEAPCDILLQAPNHYRKAHGAFALRSPGATEPDRLQRRSTARCRRDAGRCGRPRLPRRHSDT
jgi:hypothetical protein